MWLTESYWLKEDDMFGVRLEDRAWYFAVLPRKHLLSYFFKWVVLITTCIRINDFSRNDQHLCLLNSCSLVGAKRLITHSICTRFRLSTGKELLLTTCYLLCICFQLNLLWAFWHKHPLPLYRIILLCHRFFLSSWLKSFLAFILLIFRRFFIFLRIITWLWLLYSYYLGRRIDIVFFSILPIWRCWRLIMHSEIIIDLVNFTWIVRIYVVMLHLLLLKECPHLFVWCTKLHPLLQVIKFLLFLRTWENSMNTNR